jgi:hypothetical protein
MTIFMLCAFVDFNGGLNLKNELGIIQQHLHKAFKNNILGFSWTD